MWKLLVCGILASVGGVAHASEPVLVPDFTSISPDDWVVTNMVQNLVVDRLVSDGHIVLSTEVAGRAVPVARLANCGPSPTCPQDVMPAIPARLGVVVTTSRQGTTLVGHVELFLVGQAQPSQTTDAPIVPGNEQMFAGEVSRATNAMLQQIGPSPDGVLMAAARLIAGQPVQPAPPPVPVVAPLPTPMPTVVPMPVPVPVPTGPPQPLVDLDSDTPARKTPAPAPQPGAVPMVRQKKGDGSTPHEGPLQPILEGTGVFPRHLVGSEGPFRKSGLDPRDWMYRTMPHAGRLTIQISSGLAMGDVERRGVFLVERTAGAQTNAFYEEGPSAARRVRGDLYIGYAPATMIDFGIQAGLQYGGRTVTTGVVDVDSGGAFVQKTIREPQFGAALEFYLQPRLRGYLVPLGPAKPYVFTGADLRVFNSYNIMPGSDLQYLVPPGGMTPGWLGGGGLMIDPSPIVGLFAEGSYTRYFGERSLPLQDQLPTVWAHPDVYAPIPQTQGITVVVSGGVQFRL